MICTINDMNPTSPNTYYATIVRRVLVHLILFHKGMQDLDHQQEVYIEVLGTGTQQASAGSEVETGPMYSGPTCPKGA